MGAGHSDGMAILGKDSSVGKRTSLAQQPNGDETAWPASVTGPVRVAHLAERMIIAGMGNVVATLLRHTPREQYETCLWCLEDADELGRDLHAEGHEVLVIGRQRRRDPMMFLRIASLVRKKRIDILHCHDELSWFYGGIGGKLGGVPHVLVTMHGRRLDISQRHLWEQKLLSRLTSAIVCVSSYLCHQINAELGVTTSKVVQIRNGVTIPTGEATQAQRQTARARLGIPNRAFVVGAVGRLVAVKNLDLLLDAAAEARKSVPGLKVVLVGDGPCRGRLEGKAAALELKDAVLFTGLRRDIPELLPAFDVYVCTSDYEGTSLSILEAMAAGIPVIATAVGGNPELVRTGETGVLIGKRQREALVEAILALSRDDARRSRLGLEGRRRVLAHYSFDRMVLEHMRLYRALLPLPI